MNNFKLAYRRLFRKGELTITRIVSLIAGLAFGILLLSEVFYFYSFDGFYPDSKRIYIIHENFKLDKSSDKMTSHPYVSGAVAMGFKTDVPGVEAATRLNDIGNLEFSTTNKKIYKARVSFADEYVFDVLPRKVIHGNAHDILKNPMMCMVSDKIAAMIGGDIIGRTIEFSQFPDKLVTVAGIFKELPENTNYQYDLVISMSSTAQFYSWDGSINWLGNDRYYSAVKLAPNIDAKSLAPAIRKMQIKYQDIEKIEKQQGGIVLNYNLMPITNIYSDNAKEMIVILTTISLAVLLVSLMNYILLTISSMTNRVKSAAIQKSYGALEWNLQLSIFLETTILFLLSIVGAIVLIVAIKPFAEAYIGHKLISLLNPFVIFPVLSLIVLFILITSYIPGRFFSRIPVAAAFRNYQHKRNKWKLGLLFVQFAGASFILTMLVIVTLQYNHLISSDHGYSTEGVFYTATSGIDGSRFSSIKSELKGISGVEKIALGCCIPIENASGNNISLPNSDKELFNVADLYYIDENYLQVMNIPITQGENFTEQNSTANDLLISERGNEKLKIFNGWENVIGEQVNISEHGLSTIRGVFPDFIVGSMTSPDFRPSVFYYLSDQKFGELRIKYPSFDFYIFIKTNVVSDDAMIKKISAIMNQFLPHQDAEVKSMELEQQHSYRAEKGFRNAMLAGNLVILLIAVIGLTGYTTNEANSRRKELAIRRINGASTYTILRTFIIELEIIAIPAVLAGLIGTKYIATKWMQNFAVKIDLHWGIFTLCSLVVLLLVASVSVFNYYKAATRNPVEALRYE